MLAANVTLLFSTTDWITRYLKLNNTLVYDNPESVSSWSWHDMQLWVKSLPDFFLVGFAGLIHLTNRLLKLLR